MKSKIALSFLAGTLFASAPAYPWGPDGHRTVGAIADTLIAGTPAETQVKAILGGLSLQDAAVWADCAKGIDPNKNYSYTSEGRYPECRIYETPQLEAEMGDFVRRNDQNCSPKSGEESCHKQYHYTDIAIQHNNYSGSYVGSRDDDLVHAVVATAHVLKGDAAPAPFNLKDKREALLLLAHYAGDIHQPLHVGAVYLDAMGKKVNPDSGGFDPRTDTRGGNSIAAGGTNMHSKWDGIPARLKPDRLDTSIIQKAKATPRTGGGIYDWPAAWASDTLKAARAAYQGVTFSGLPGGHWSATLPATYTSDANALKEKQLEKAGARLAQLLQAIWP